MLYRKGELSPASVDRGWPHQVALPASASLNGGVDCVAGVNERCACFYRQTLPNNWLRPRKPLRRLPQ
jgi:hypothetical protein